MFVRFLKKVAKLQCTKLSEKGTTHTCLKPYWWILGLHAKHCFDLNVLSHILSVTSMNIKDGNNYSERKWYTQSLLLYSKLH